MINAASNMIATIQTTLVNAAGQTQSKVTQVWIWLGVVMLLAVVLGTIVAVVRKIYISNQDSNTDCGYSISDLRQLHKEGKISDEEFDNAKQLIIAQSQAMLGDKYVSRDINKKDENIDLSEENEESDDFLDEDKSGNQ